MPRGRQVLQWFAPRRKYSLARPLQTADNVKFHEVGGAADAHRCARDDADDVAFFNQALFEEALFGNIGEAVDLLDVGDVAGSDAPEKGHAAARGRFGRKCDDGNERAIAGDESRGETAVGEDSDELHMQFAARMADEFGDGFGDLELFLRGGGPRIFL